MADFNTSDALAAAEAIRRQQTAKIAVAVAQVLARLAAPVTSCVISGRGEFLARRVLERMKIAARLVSLSEALGAQNCRAVRRLTQWRCWPERGNEP